MQKKDVEILAEERVRLLLMFRGGNSELCRRGRVIPLFRTHKTMGLKRDFTHCRSHARSNPVSGGDRPKRAGAGDLSIAACIQRRVRIRRSRDGLWNGKDSRSLFGLFPTARSGSGSDRATLRGIPAENLAGPSAIGVAVAVRRKRAMVAVRIEPPASDELRRLWRRTVRPGKRSPAIDDVDNLVSMTRLAQHYSPLGDS
jgi:hypothetical protein